MGSCTAGLPSCQGCGETFSRTVGHSRRDLDQSIKIVTFFHFSSYISLFFCQAELTLVAKQKVMVDTKVEFKRAQKEKSGISREKAAIQSSIDVSLSLTHCTQPV